MREKKKKTTSKIVVVRILLFGGTGVSLFFVPWILIKTWLLPLPDTVQGQLEQAMGLGLDGIIVYVEGEGSGNSYAAGWHDRENKIPADPNAYFKIASVGKLYDAVAITKLVSSGRLSLDKTLADYFPGLQGHIEYADRITLRLMAQHRSGIPNYTDTPNFWTNPPESAEETLALILDQPANFAPDEDYEYSNTNYLLISQLIEKVSGTSNSKYISEEILQTLGLQHTFGSLHEVDVENLMGGYYVGIDEDIKTADYGSMIATAADVGIFLRALNDGSLFDEGEREIYSSIYVYGHEGLIPGYQTIARYHEDIDTVVIQFVNTTNFSGYTWSIGTMVYQRILKILRRKADNQ